MTDASKGGQCLTNWITTADGDGAMTFVELRIDVVILACAVSAGIHGPRRGSLPGRNGSRDRLCRCNGSCRCRSHADAQAAQFAFVAAAAILIGLIASYGLAISTGVPVLHPDVEAVDGLALFTKAVEVIGAVAAASLVRRRSLTPFTQPKGTLT